jgi:hypothetical protein
VNARQVDLAQVPQQRLDREEVYWNAKLFRWEVLAETCCGV